MSVHEGREPTEDELVASARDGDPAGFDALYRRYLPDVRAFCARRINDPVRAEDLAQDCFVRAYEHIRGFRPGAPFWPWLSTIARNLCTDELRARMRTSESLERATPASDDPTSDAAIAAVGRAQMRAAIARALSMLRTRDRSMLWSRDVDRLSYRQIARAHGSTVDAVRNTTWRARRTVRAALETTARDLLGLAGLIAGLRSIARRLRRWQAELAGAERALLEQGAFALAGLAMVGGLSSTPSVQERGTLRPDAPSIVRGEMAAMVAVRDPVRVSAKGSRAPAAGIEAEHESIPARIGTKTRDGAAAPTSTNYRIEVRAPDGELLYWQEAQIECEPDDGWSSDALPASAEVRMYC